MPINLFYIASKYPKQSEQNGFTLIELSIVLVIIGLIIGGILTGQDLIKSAAIRAQLSQIEHYNTAANTFYNKYGQLPGDIMAKSATQFGFVARSGVGGDGDGNGELDGTTFIGTTYSFNQDGENLYFWEDLSAAGLIDGSFTNYVDYSITTCSTASACSIYFPQAKIGGGDLVYVYSGSASTCCANTSNFGPNYYGIAMVSGIAFANVSTYLGGNTQTGLTVQQAYNMDKKIDDGLPTTGQVLAQYLSNASNGYPGWSANGNSVTSTTCYDTSSGSAKYSLINGGNGMNCGLSFQMQAR